MSRAEKYTTRGASASKFLASISGSVTTSRYSGSGELYADDSILKPEVPRDVYQERELELYSQCPARFRYEIVEGLRGGKEESPYVCFHRCVYITVGWLEQERQNGRITPVAEALAQLANEWAKQGPEHAFEKYYRAAAEKMVKILAESIAAETAQYDRQEWNIPLGARKVAISPDRVVKSSEGLIHVQRIRTGRKTKSEAQKPIYALLRRGASLMYPGASVSVETYYLGTGEQLNIPPRNDDKLLATYSEAIAGIERGDFHAEPDPRRCPSCQCYFICGK